MTVVQGDDFCEKGGNAAGLSALENITNQLINNSKPVVSEITLYGPCGYSQSTYESDINSLFGNVAATYPTKARNYFYGVTLDEEAGYNISVSELVSINTVAASDANNFGSNVTIGDYTEAFAGCGDWTQSQFNQVYNGGFGAGQVPTTCMKNYINGDSNAFENDVTWSTTYPAPYNTESYSDNAISRSAASLYFAGGPVYYMDNHFIPS